MDWEFSRVTVTNIDAKEERLPSLSGKRMAESLTEKKNIIVDHAEAN